MLQNLQNFAKFQNFQLDNLVDFEKCCKTRILNYYFLAKIGADTPENEQHFAENLPKTGNYPTGPTVYAEGGGPSSASKVQNVTGCGCPAFAWLVALQSSTLILLRNKKVEMQTLKFKQF